MEYSYEEIRSRIKQRLKNAANTIEGSFAMDNVQAVAQELAQIINMELLLIPDNVFLDTAEGIMLDRKALDFYEKRIAAQSATGYLEFSGNEGALIPVGTKVRNDHSYYETLEEGLIQPSGKIVLKAQCTEPGSEGNTDASTITEFLSSISGVSEVTNPQPFEGGKDLESDEHFRNRIIEKIQKPITSGNANHYEYWAKQVSGVGKAKVVPLWNGNGTVKVIILSADNDVPDDVVLTNVKEYIEKNRPIGATVTVSKAIPVPVTVAISLTLSVGYNLENVKQNIVKELDKYLQTIAFDTTKRLSYYKVGDVIFDVPGVMDISSYTVNGGTVSLETKYEEFFKLQEVLINGS